MALFSAHFIHFQKISFTIEGATDALNEVSIGANKGARDPTYFFTLFISVLVIHQLIHLNLLMTLSF